MTALLNTAPTVLAAFLASMVEFVEALTIVLAVGVSRGWKWTLLGTAASVAVLIALVLALGRSLSAIPLPVLQLTVGILLLMFGMRWLSKAVLRAAGAIPLHDETQAFARELKALRATPSFTGGFDGIAFIAAFKAVLLEGLEVVFIVVALGVKGDLLLPASAGAVLALLLVTALGVVLHRPLAKVPENTLKFGVGVLLTAFGTYWAAEGIGLAWPAGDLSIVALIGAFLAVALVLVRTCRRLHAAAPTRPQGSAGTGTPAQQSALGAAAAEIFGLFVDDLPLALGLLGWVALMAFLHSVVHPVDAAIGPFVFAAGLAFISAWSAMRRAYQ